MHRFCLVFFTFAWYSVHVCLQNSVWCLYCTTLLHKSIFVITLFMFQSWLLLCVVCFVVFLAGLCTGSSLVFFFFFFLIYLIRSAFLIPVLKPRCGTVYVLYFSSVRYSSPFSLLCILLKLWSASVTQIIRSKQVLAKHISAFTLVMDVSLGVTQYASLFGSTLVCFSLFFFFLV